MRFLGLLAALLLAGPAAAMSSAAGTSGAQFLKLGVGARATAMGGACAAVCSDAYSLYWNPAGLSRISSRGEAVAFHGRPFGLLEQDFAAVAVSVKSLDAVLAAGFSRLGAAQNGFDAADRPTGDFAEEDTALGLGGATRLEIFPSRAYEDERTLRVGGAVKFIRQSMPGTRISGAAVDLGLQGAAFEGADHALRWGLSVLNLGPGLGASGMRAPLPMYMNLGLAYEARSSGLLLTAEVPRPRDGESDLRLGAEWRPIAFAHFRAGLSSLRNAAGPLSSLSLGGGLSVRSFEFGVSFVGHADLGRALLFDIKWHW